MKIEDMSNRQLEDLIHRAEVELQDRHYRAQEHEDYLADLQAQEDIKQSRRMTGA